ncbi:MAG: polysaccharide biosynthesis C-terminal domain-containing protein, partial [Fibrobacteres bacterium]|nr:polysaccharide biosynthesis C-terminal domain-containing protein [Fibrobacterota bacterium]
HHMQLNGYIAVLAINSLVSALVLGRIVTKRGIMTSNSFRSKEQLKDIVRFTFFAWLASILSAFMWQRMEIYFIQRFLSSLDVAFFSIAISLSTLITQPIGLLSSAIRPYFSVNHNTLAGTVRQENIYCFLTKISAWLTFFFCFIIAAQSRFFVSLVYGEAYLPAWQVVAIVVAGSSFGTIASVGSSLVLGYGKSKFIALSSMIGAALAIGVGFMIIPVFGIIGASISRVIIQILMIGLGTVYIYIYLKVPFPFTSYFKSMFLSLLIATMFYLLCKNAHQILVILYCLISFLLYILLSHLVKVFSQEDYMYVKTALKAKGIIRSRKNKELI